MMATPLYSIPGTAAPSSAAAPAPEMATARTVNDVLAQSQVEA